MKSLTQTGYSNWKRAIIIRIITLSMFMKSISSCYAYVNNYATLSRSGISSITPKFASRTRNSQTRLFSSIVDKNGQPRPPSTYEERYQQMISSSKLSLAPMMEYTDRHFRHLVRLVSSNTLLYTEMVASNAIVHERNDAMKRKHDLTHEPTGLLKEQVEQDIEEYGYDMTYLRRFIGMGRLCTEGPSVLQLGGSDPQQLEDACQTVMQLTDRGYCDYTAINLNCGCPSPKVAGKGCFGAALMEDADLVKNLVTGMHNGANGEIPITVKCRIGTDKGYSFTKTGYEEVSDEEEYANLRRFIETVASSGVVTDFQVHARIAVLSKNFSPSDNRKVPKLKYDLVRRLVEDYPELSFSLNGGVNTLLDTKAELNTCENMAGVMIGRAWAANPWSFSMADSLLYGDNNENTIISTTSPNVVKPRNRLEVLKAFGQHADAEEELWDPIKIRRFLIKAVTPLFAGEPNGKKYRIALDEIARIPKKLKAQGKTLEDSPPISELIMNAAVDNIREEILLRTPEESFERMIGGTSSSARADREILKDWQQDRKSQGETVLQATN